MSQKMKFVLRVPNPSAGHWRKELGWEEYSVVLGHIPLKFEFELLFIHTGDILVWTGDLLQQADPWKYQACGFSGNGT